MALTVSVAELVNESKNPLLHARAGWPRVKLGEIATVLNGYAFKSDLFTRDDGVPLIRIRDVGSTASETRYKGEFDARYLVHAGELLVGMDGDFNCARWRGVPSLLNQRVCKITVHSEEYDSRFLDYLLPGYLKAINEATSAITVKHLSSRTIEEIPLPKPPLDEQVAIVEEFEKQFSRLDEAVANLKRVKANLKRYKAAVLKAAVEGRLVPTEADLARKEGRTYETGTELLNRILAMRRKVWHGKGKYKEPIAPDAIDIPDLPEGWTCCAADQLFEKITDGEHLSPSISTTGVPLLSAKDVLDEGVVFDDAKFVSAADAEKFRSRCGPERDDILIVSRGATIGRACRVNVGHKFCLMGSVILIKPNTLLDSAYILVTLKAGYFFTRLTTVSGSTAQQAIYIRDVRPLQLPLPPLAEQRRIVEEVERRLSLIRGVEAQVDANLKRAERMRQAFLQTAFTASPDARQ